MVKSMYKYEFANRFYGVDRKTLMRWINSNEELLEKLKNISYKPENRMLTPMQIELIREYLG